MEPQNDILEGSGYLFHIYHYFWMKDPNLEVTPILNLPDTVLFKDNQPYAWYFGVNNQTKRKLKENINLENIERQFLKKSGKEEIVAMWVTKNFNDSLDNEY
jgi:hypothetical protein